MKNITVTWARQWEYPPYQFYLTELGPNIHITKALAERINSANMQTCVLGKINGKMTEIYIDTRYK